MADGTGEVGVDVDVVGVGPGELVVTDADGVVGGGEDPVGAGVPARNISATATTTAVSRITPSRTRRRRLVLAS